MKIGMSGAHSTGKSAMFNACRSSKDFSNFVFLGSSSRQLASRVPINQNATMESQFLIITSMLAKEVYSAQYPNLLTERTPLDALAYTYYQNKHIFDGRFDSHMEMAEESVKMAMKSYDTVCYFPVYWGIEDDGVRPTDTEYQKQINIYIMMFMERFGIRPYVMQNEPVDKRLGHLVEWKKRRL